MFYDCAAPIIPWHNTYFSRSQTYFSLLRQPPPIWSSLTKVLQQTSTSTLKYYRNASESWGFLQRYWEWSAAHSSSPTSRTDLWRPEPGWGQKFNTLQHWLQQGSENKSLNCTLRHQLLKPDYAEKGLPTGPGQFRESQSIFKNTQHGCDTQDNSTAWRTSMLHEEHKVSLNKG